MEMKLEQIKRGSWIAGSSPPPSAHMSLNAHMCTETLSAGFFPLVPKPQNVHVQNPCLQNMGPFRGLSPLFLVKQGFHLSTCQSKANCHKLQFKEWERTKPLAEEAGLRVVPYSPLALTEVASNFYSPNHLQMKTPLGTLPSSPEQVIGPTNLLQEWPE